MDLAEFPKFLEKTGRKVFTGLMWFEAPGHMVEEFDRISRLLYIDKDLASRKPFVIIPSTEQTRLIQKIFEFSKVPVQFINHDSAWMILRELEIHYPEHTIPVGQSHFYYGPSTPTKKPNMSMGTRLGFGKSLQDFCNETIFFYDLISKTKTYNVFKKFFKENTTRNEFFEILAEKTKPVLCLQYKKLYNNALAREMSDENYKQIISMALDRGYDLYLAGRDQLPDSLRNFPIENYAKSKFATFENDFILASKTDTAFFYSSGVSHIFQIFVRRLVQIGCWLMFPYFYENVYMLPALVVDSRDKTPLSFGGLVRISELAWQPAGYSFENLQGFDVLDYKEMHLEQIFENEVSFCRDEFLSTVNSPLTAVWKKVESKFISLVPPPKTLQSTI